LQYRLIIFDLDGTLADSFPVFLRVMEEVTREFRLRAVPAEELPALRQLGAREVIQRIGLPWWKLPRVGKFVHRRMAEHLAEIPLFSGIEPTLRHLHANGVKLALVTSNSEPNACAILGEPLAALFSVFECGASLFGKRSRFDRVIRRVGVDRPATLTVGDELRDAEAARASGLDFAAVTWGYTAGSTLERENPAFVFREPGELRRLVAPAS
jgi:phosphoglycolate phosphatase